MGRVSPLLIPASIAASLLLLLFPASSSAKTPSGKEIIRNVQSSFQKLDTFSCTFRLEFTWAVVEESDVSEGTIEMASGNRFRYETRNQVTVTDGTILWRYNPVSSQCIVENLRSAGDAILPRDLLFDYPKKFDIESVKEINLDGRLAYELHLSPREGGLEVEQVVVWIDASDYITRSMRYSDTSGNRTLYTLDSIQINPGLPDERFTVTLPEETRVFDLR